MKKRLILVLLITNGCALANLGYWLYMLIASRGDGYPTGPMVYYWYVYYPRLMFPTLIILPFLFSLPIIMVIWREVKATSPTYFMASSRSSWIQLVLVFGCLVSFAPFLIGSGSSTGELRHQASIKYEGHIYHFAELSRWSKTEDILYQCDQFGIICTAEFAMDMDERATVLDQLKERR